MGPQPKGVGWREEGAAEDRAGMGSPGTDASCLVYSGGTDPSGVVWKVWWERGKPGSRDG